ncbi:aspartate--tRNA ligase [candidate division LCP-89 bacterium B3_LCP]|uniref:Aspartate--tRNA(Asp/Asn) ligase n=1 Tax=candidate division LCP-89 bacterium B3_LCP TaxID=2012998 RepID=A0A532V617_UNCL8|nr:MAG: aspartate--tRNA ligase [candidate division LCP-89 bacterium B3_LCP]
MKNRTYCGEIDISSSGESVVLCGWIHRVRDLGGLSFFLLRDHTGIIQVTPAPDDETVQNLIGKLRHEDVVKVTGTIRKRPDGNVNPKMSTGEIEIAAIEIEILSAAKVPPFLPEEAERVQEDLRLKHRVLHLRTEKMQRNFRLRHQLYQSVRRYFDENGFCEIETPFLVKPTPEGARDFLVPSRLHPTKTYALPQSPQIYKQLLMVAGFDRYFQIVKCFRDEDLRADRQPEFTQIDAELSFTDEEEIQEIVEGLMVRIYKEVKNIEIDAPFPRITYSEAISLYGSDKPDLRIPLKITDLTETFRGSDFRVFSSAIEAGGAIRGLNLPGCGGYSRKKRDELIHLSKSWGLGGLVYFMSSDEGISSSAAKFLSEAEMAAAVEKCDIKPGDMLAVAADASIEKVALGMGQLRSWAGKNLNLISEVENRLCWITDFPMFEYNDEIGRYQAAHHPFTLPVEEDLDKYENEPGRIRSKAYDLVLNGHEIAGGSIRIHDREIQRKVFELLGFKEEETRERFGFLLEALEYGTPPHGGIAFGLDRMAMIMAGVDSIREVIAFPKTTAALSLMDGSPAVTDEKQWLELGLKPIGKAKGN